MKRRAKDKIPTIDQTTGTTLEERQRIRKRYKSEQVQAKRGIRSRATTDEYRSGYSQIDWQR